jgi:hypothetical protein
MKFCIALGGKTVNVSATHWIDPFKKMLIDVKDREYKTP